MQFQHEIFGRDTRENILLAFRLFTLQATTHKMLEPKIQWKYAYSKLVRTYNVWMNKSSKNNHTNNYIIF